MGLGFAKLEETTTDFIHTLETLARIIFVCYAAVEDHN